MIRVFVGCPANNEDLESQAVLEWSMRKHSKRDIDITWMMLSRDPASFWFSDPQTRKGWNTKTWATPFSALRWGIPAACNFEGKAIYVDSDMILRADIGELWDQPFSPGKSIAAKAPEISCVMLMDCARLKPALGNIERIKSEQGFYRTIRKSLTGMVQRFDGDWNCRDGEDYADINDPNIKLLHYTSIPTQPNHKHARARLAREGKPHWFAGPDKPHWRPEINEIFDGLLEEAIANGYGPERYRAAQEFGEYGR